MNSVVKLIDGRIRAKVSGLNHSLLFRKLTEKGVTFFDVCENEGGFLFSVFAKDFKLVKKYSKLLNINLELISRSGLAAFGLGVLRRSGAILGLLIWIIASLWFGSTKVFVNVNADNFISNSNELGVTGGADSVKRAEIISARVNEFLLGEIKSGEKNLRALERSVQLKFNEVSTCSVTKKGVSYIVSISPVIEVVKAAEIVSPFNCIITDMTVASGEAVVKKGDTVFAGQTLVKSLSNGDKIEPAQAKISVKAYVYKTEYFDENSVKFVRTGNLKTVRNLSIFGLNLTSSKVEDFALYETETKTFDVSKNAFLPLKINQTTYFELKGQPAFVEFESVKEEVIARARCGAQKLVPRGVEGAQETVSITQEGSVYKVDVYLCFDFEF